MPKTLKRLPTSAFMHPGDAEAFDILRHTSGFETFFKKIMHYGMEKALRQQMLGSCVRVSEAQIPSLYADFLEMKKTLDVTDDVELYVMNERRLNGFTAGSEKVTLAVTSGALELLDRDERRFLLAHELGHIKCGHVLYLFIAQNLRFILTLLAQMTMGVGVILGQALFLALLAWMRKAELTADRAGVLGVQDERVALRALMKLAGGSHEVYAEMDEAEFEKQAEELERMDGIIDSIWQTLIVTQQTHPWVSVRVREMKKWVREGNYKDLVDGDYAGAPPVVPDTAPGAVPTVKRVCPRCGTKNEMQEMRCVECRNPLIVGWRSDDE